MPYISEVTIRDMNNGRKIARVGLNGYRSFTQSPAGQHSRRTFRLLWSFTLLDGDLRKLCLFWERKLPVLLCTPNGREVPVKVVALPASHDAFGLFEFPHAVVLPVRSNGFSRQD